MWWRKNPLSRIKIQTETRLKQTVDMEAKLEDAKRKAIKEIQFYEDQ